MISSTTKCFLICIASLFYLSACGAPADSGGSSNGDSSGTSSASSNTSTVPTVEVLREKGELNLIWDDMNAALYRVLYWQDSDGPDEFTTAGTAYTLPPLSRGDYTVILEAYDSLGNSVFSAPVSMEVF